MYENFSSFNSYASATNPSHIFRGVYYQNKFMNSQNIKYYPGQNYFKNTHVDRSRFTSNRRSRHRKTIRKNSVAKTQVSFKQQLFQQVSDDPVVQEMSDDPLVQDMSDIDVDLSDAETVHLDEEENISGTSNQTKKLSSEKGNKSIISSTTGTNAKDKSQRTSVNIIEHILLGENTSDDISTNKHQLSASKDISLSKSKCESPKIGIDEQPLLTTSSNANNDTKCSLKNLLDHGSITNRFLKYKESPKKVERKQKHFALLKDMPILDDCDDSKNNKSTITTNTSEDGGSKLNIKTVDHRKNLKRSSTSMLECIGRKSSIDMLSNKTSGKDTIVDPKKHKNCINENKDFSQQSDKNLKEKTSKHVSGTKRPFDETTMVPVRNEKSKETDKHSSNKKTYDKQRKSANGIRTAVSIRSSVSAGFKNSLGNNVTITKIEAASGSDSEFKLCDEEEITRLNTNLDNLESTNTENSSETHLTDFEVEEIMCKQNSQSEIEQTKNESVAGPRKRGKSCIPFDRSNSEHSNLIRSKSLQAKDFLCYTPFRITRSISRNWLLSPGITDGNIQSTFEINCDSTKNEIANIRKRRKTIDICEIPKKKPSLFSEQTTHVMPDKIEFDYTPRYIDEYIEDVMPHGNTSDVTIVYRDSNPQDPSNKAGTNNINYNGRELVKYKDYIKESSILQQKPAKSKDNTSKKIHSRRKSSHAKNDDPDYVPHGKITLAPRCTQVSICSTVKSTADAIHVKDRNDETRSPFPHEAVDIKIVKRKEHVNEIKGLDINTVANVEHQFTVTNAAQSIYKDTINRDQQSNQRNSLKHKLKHYSECVSFVLIENGISAPLILEQVETFKSSFSIVQRLPLNTPKVTIATIDLPKRMKNRRILSKRQIAPNISTSFDIRTEIRPDAIMENLRDCILAIHQLKVLQSTYVTQLKKSPLPTPLKGAETNCGNVFFQMRLDYWIKQFKNFYEMLNSKIINTCDFAVNLLKSVMTRDLAYSLPMCLDDLNMIVNTYTMSPKSARHIFYLKCIVGELVKIQATKEINQAPANIVPSQLNPIDQNQQSTSTDSQAALCHGPNRIGKSAVVPSTMSPVQLRQLQRQINKHQQLLVKQNILMRSRSSEDFRTIKQAMSTALLPPRYLLNNSNIRNHVSLGTGYPQTITQRSEEAIRDINRTCAINSVPHKLPIIGTRRNASNPVTVPTSSKRPLVSPIKPPKNIRPAPLNTQTICDVNRTCAVNSASCELPIAVSRRNSSNSITAPAGGKCPLVSPIQLFETTQLTLSNRDKELSIIVPEKLSNPITITVVDKRQLLAPTKSCQNILIPSNTANESPATATPRNSSNCITTPVAHKLPSVSPIQSARNIQPTASNTNRDGLNTINLDLRLLASKNSNKSSTVSQSRGDMDFNLRRTNDTEEFVDLERYFNPCNNSSLAKTPQHEVVLPKSLETSNKRQRLSEVSKEVPVRTESNDSGIGSPSQVDFLIYENRVCVCGEPADYVCPCKTVIYCSESCQLTDWLIHKDSFEHKSGSMYE